MRSIFAAALLVSLVPVVHAADVDNPYTNAKVGDWVEYKMTGNNIEGKTKMTVTAKDDKELTYEVEGTVTFMGREQTAPIQTLKIDLTKSYDPVVAENLKRKNVKLEKIDEGTEKIKVGDKEYDTKWTKTKAISTVQNNTVETVYTMWLCKDVPLSGMVKMESTNKSIVMKMELIGSGKK